MLSRKEEARKEVGKIVRAIRNDRSEQVECLFAAAVENIVRYYELLIEGCYGVSKGK